MEELSLREIQLVELSLLCDFDRICRAHGLKYTLAYGTLLGAVRHGGFIPWDDDLDVLMPRPDYERLYSIFSDRKGVPIYLSRTEDRGKDIVYPFMKILVTRYKIAVPGIREVENIWLDVFPVDGIPSDEKKYKKLKKKQRFYKRVVYFNNLTDSAYYVGRMKLFLPIFRLFAKMYTLKRAASNSRKWALKYPYFGSGYCGGATLSANIDEEKYPEGFFENIKETEFEGKKFFSVADTDFYLRTNYGDYMSLPPESERVNHRFKCVRADK